MTQEYCSKEKEIAILQEQMKGTLKRLDKLEVLHQEIKDMNANIKLLVHQIGEITTKVSDNYEEIEIMKQRPAKEYNQIKTAIIISSLTLIVGALIGKLL